MRNTVSPLTDREWIISCSGCVPRLLCCLKQRKLLKKADQAGMTSVLKDKPTLLTSVPHILHIVKIKRKTGFCYLLQYRNKKTKQNKTTFLWGSSQSAYLHLWLCHRRRLETLPPKTQCRTLGGSLRIYRTHKQYINTVLYASLLWYHSPLNQYEKHLIRNSPWRKFSSKVQ